MKKGWFKISIVGISYTCNEAGYEALNGKLVDILDGLEQTKAIKKP